MPRLQSEGDKTPAGMVVTVNTNRVQELSESRLLASLSPKIQRQVTAYSRDNNDDWTALSLRTRITAVSVQKVENLGLSGIAYLVKPSLKGRVCTHGGSHVCNRALLTSIITKNSKSQ